jgi:hypothetical protein
MFYLRFARTLTHIPAYPEKAEQSEPKEKLIPEKMHIVKLLIVITSLSPTFINKGSRK